LPKNAPTSPVHGMDANWLRRFRSSAAKGPALARMTSSRPGFRGQHTLGRGCLDLSLLLGLSDAPYGGALLPHRGPIRYTIPSLRGGAEGSFWTRPSRTMKSKQPAGQAMSGADILVEALIRQGVEVVFAYPGGASMPIHQSLTKVEDRLRTILPRHEKGGGFMAHGYARTTGKVGVCMATSGPGATNFVTCLADAKMDSTPIIAITGQVSTPVIGTDAFQETPIIEVCRGITKHHYLVTRIEDLTRIVKEAFHIATTGRPGPVIIDIPKDIQIKEAIPDWNAAMDLPGYKPPRKPKRPELEPIVAAIRASKRPFIYAGGGVTHSAAAAELREFAELTGIPVGLTLHGIGNFPADHYLCLHMLGMHGTVYSNYAVNDADLLLAFGVRFDDRVTGKLSEFARHGKIVHIDIDPSEIHKNKYAHVPVHGDLRDALRQLNAMLREDANADLVGGGRYT